MRGEKGLFYLIAPQGIDRMELMGRALVFMGTLSTFHGCNRYNHLILSYPTIFHLVIINRHLGGPGVAFARMAQSSGAVAVVIQQREKVTLIILQDYYSFAYSSSFFLSVLAWPDDGHDPSCYHPLLGCTSGCHGIPGYQSSSDCCHSVSYYLTSWYSIRHIIMMSLMYTYIYIYISILNLISQINRIFTEKEAVALIVRNYNGLRIAGVVLYPHQLSIYNIFLLVVSR